MDELTLNARRARVTANVSAVDGGDVDARFRTLVQSPLRADLLRHLHSLPDSAFDVDELVQTFGRLRLDIENCLRELRTFGVVAEASGSPRRYIAQRPDHSAALDLLPRTARRSQPRGSVARRSAIPGNDRPRREDADRLRVDPDGGQV
jgi:hypothetical protein